MTPAAMLVADAAPGITAKLATATLNAQNVPGSEGRCGWTRGVRVRVGRFDGAAGRTNRSTGGAEARGARAGRARGRVAGARRGGRTHR